VKIVVRERDLLLKASSMSGVIVNSCYTDVTQRAAVADCRCVPLVFPALFQCINKILDDITPSLPPHRRRAETLLRWSTSHASNYIAGNIATISRSLWSPFL